LVDEMVAAAGGQTAALAVLQFVASQLWEQRDDARRLLLRAAYQRIGGVEGALARHADGVLAGLSPEELKLARSMLLKLVTPEGARKMIPPSHALGGLGAKGRRVLGRLTQARLVAVTKMPGDATAPIMLELAHESLIRAWKTLAHWIDESKEELTFLGDIGQAARLWHKRGRRPEELWEGDALHEALRGLEKCTTRPTEQVVAFVEAGRTRQSQRLRRRRWLMAAAFALLAAVALGASLAAAYVARQRNVVAEQRNLAEQRRAEALREGARAALGQGNVLEARAKLREALEIEDSPGARALWLQLSAEPLLLRQHFAVPLYVVAAAPDGRTVAVAGQDGAIYLVDATTGQSRVLRGHTDQVMALGYSPDGRWLASAGLDTTVRIWDAASGATVHSAMGHRGGIFGVAFSPDGSLLASASADKTVRLWNVSSGEPRAVLEGHEAMVRSVSFSPDGKVLASGGVDRTVRLWQLGSAREPQVLRGHEGDVMAVAFSPDGSLLASAAYDRTIRLWEPNGALHRTLTGHVAGIVALSFSPDGRRLGSASADKTVRLWDVGTGETLHTLEHEGQVWSVAFGPDGHRLATASGDKQLRIWDVDGAGARPPPEGHGAAVTSVSFSPDGQQLASAGYDRTVRLWEVRTGRPLRTIEGHEGEAMAVSFSPDGKLLASGGADRTVRLWNAGSGVEDRVLSGHQLQVFSVAFSPDGTRLASASFDRTVRLWDLASGATDRVLLHQDRVWDVAFSPDGSQLATGSYDGTARIWDAKTGEVLRVLRGHQDRVYGVHFSPDGKTLATGSYDHTIRLWDVATGSGRELGAMPGRVYGLDFQPNGKRLVASCSDGTPRIWDLATGASIELRGHLNETNATRFSPDGTLVATASDDGTVRVWDADGGRPFWRAPALVGASPELFSHEGWRRLEPREPSTPAGAQWRTAIEQRAQYASESPDHELLCIQTFEQHLELWELGADRRLAERPVAGLAQVLGAPWGCALLTADGAQIIARTGEAEPLAIEGKPTALGWGDGRLLIAAGDEVLAFGAAGSSSPGGLAVARYRASLGISALAEAGGSIFVGYRDGSLEALSVIPGQPTAAHSFEQVPSSPVMRIVPGPADTLFVGYGNGLLGMWSGRDGTPLDRTLLHGPIVHLKVEGQKLYAATELGRSLVRDLSVFHLDRCALLSEVWREVPVVWQQGRAVQQAPPAGHRCRP
jgi:WD40 repeat protein